MNLVELQAKFSNGRKCRKYLEKMRWPNGVACPRCGSQTISRLEKYHRFECADCEYQFSVTSGTIMHRTRLPLCKWLIAIHLVSESKKGISAKQLERHLGVTYKTAWYLSHRIRNAMTSDSVEDKLAGVLEVDETYVGGKDDTPGRPGKGSNKQAVLGIVERDGRVKCKAVPGVSGRDIFEFIDGSIARDAVEVIYSDEWGGYNVLKGYVPHEKINHQISYVEGDVHTNSIESFWSLLKRGIMGAFHHVSIKHLPRYLNEFSWRFNERENGDIFDAVLRNVERPHVRYADMVG